MNSVFRTLRRSVTAGVAVLAFVSSAAFGQAACGLCDKDVVITADLASCFLEQYQELASESGQAVVVDLTQCSSRGVIEALPSPKVGVEEPDTRFMISRAQLDCLKQKLEEPGLVLDPAVKIDLESCG